MSIEDIHRNLVTFQMSIPIQYSLNVFPHLFRGVTAYQVVKSREV